MGTSERVLGGRFRLEERIEHGDAFEVHRATDLRTEREVVVRIALTTGARRGRMLREAKRVARVKHPGLAAVVDVGEAEGTGVFLASEPVPGERLSARLAREEPLTLTDATSIALGVCRAIEAAHDADVAHRDLRPEQVVLTEDGVVVLGLGLARRDASADEDDAFAAPEQRRGEPAGRRADVYAIGAMLEAMVPDDEVPEVLREVLGGCLSDDPRDRFADAAELGVSIEAALVPEEEEEEELAPSSAPPAKRTSSRPPKRMSSAPPAKRMSSAPPAKRMSSKPPKRMSSRPPKRASGSPRAPAAPPSRPLGRPLTVRPAWEEKLLDIVAGPAPRVAGATVVAFVIARILTSGFVPWAAALVVGVATFFALRLRRAGDGQT